MRREDRDVEADLGQVLAIRDELGEAVAKRWPTIARIASTANAGSRAISVERDGQELRAPALARAERAERAPARERDDREPRRAAHAVVAGVAGVLEPGAHAIAPITASSSVRSPGSSARRLTPVSAHASRTAAAQRARVAAHREPALLAVLDLRPRAVSAARSAARSPMALQPRGAGVAAEQVGDAAARRDAAVAQHDHGIARALDVLEHVRREQHADAEIAREPAHELEHLVAALRVEAVRGLVEHHELGRVHERLGELDPLAHARRERPDQAHPLLLQPHLEEHLARAQDGDASRQPAQLAQVHDEVTRRHPARQAFVLGHVADTPPQLEAARSGVDAEQPRAAGVGIDESEQRAHERRLARAVRSQQADRLVAQLHADLVERDDRSEALGQPGGGDRRTLGGRQPPANLRRGGPGSSPGRRARLTPGAR